MQEPDMLPTEGLANQWRAFMVAIPWQIGAQQFNLLDSHDTRRMQTVVHEIERATGPGRALRHCLTLAGESLLNEGRTVINEVLSESFSPLSPTELDTFYDLLHEPDGPLVD